MTRNLLGIQKNLVQMESKVINFLQFRKIVIDTCEDFLSQDENIAPTPTNRSIPNVLKAHNNVWKKNETEFIKHIPLTDRPLQKK